MAEETKSPSEAPAPTRSALDAFVPHPDVRERHETIVHAPADLVFDVARRFDIQSISLVRAIFWLRARLLRAKAAPAAGPGGLSPKALLGMGWGVLLDHPGRLFVAGAACQPWRADVVFTPLEPDRFAAHDEPDCVKIAWTLEAEPLGPELARFATETRAVATDAHARTKFRRYWRLAGVGILAIRWLLVPAVRRRAEGLWRACCFGLCAPQPEDSSESCCCEVTPAGLDCRKALGDES